jgi:hypothetical protein
VSVLAARVAHRCDAVAAVPEHHEASVLHLGW